MTHLIIHTDIIKRREYLLKEINRHLERNFATIAQLHDVPDIHIVELTEKSSIGIDVVKAFQKEMIFQPFEELYQVGIIFHSSALTTEAQNAMLKTLEEVGDRTLYYLLADNERNLLQTIVSRSIKHYVKGTEGAENNEDEEEVKLERPEILDMNLTEQFQEIEKLISAEKKDKTVVREFINLLMKYFRQQMHNGDTPKENAAKLQLINDAYRKISANVNKRLALENLILKLRTN